MTYLHINRKTTKRIPRLDGKRVLEIGTGAFQPLYEQMTKARRKFRKKNIYVGIDINPEAVEYAKSNIKSTWKLSAHFVKCDADGNDLPFKTGSFDEVHLHMFCPGIGADHGGGVRPFKFLLTECSRVLDYGGKLFISVDETFFAGDKEDYDKLALTLKTIFGEENVNIKANIGKKNEYHMNDTLRHQNHEAFSELFDYTDFAEGARFYAVCKKIKSQN